MDESQIPDLDWAIYFDEESEREYFYNRVTKETQWDMPEEVRAWRKSVTVAYLRAIDSPWRIAEKESSQYFYNKLTKKSHWERPQELSEIDNYLIALTQQRRDVYDASEDTDLHVDAHSELVEDLGSVEDIGGMDAALDNGNQELRECIFQQEHLLISNEAEQNQIESQEPELEDPVTELAGLEQRLDARDSIMEKGVFSVIEKYLKMSKVHPETIVKKLSSSYSGYAKMTEILHKWLIMTNSADQSVNSQSVVAADPGSGAESVFVVLLSNFIKQKFDKLLADSIIHPGAQVPAWIEIMIKEEHWRRLLIELLDSNRGSALLGYCLREISALGYHREIGEVIREADYFLVFNNLLQDILMKSPSAGDQEIANRTNDLIRMCGNCDYLFYYSQIFLSQTESNLSAIHKTKKRSSDAIGPSELDDVPLKRRRVLLDKTVSRISRIRQELERNVVWSNIDCSESSDLQRRPDSTLLSMGNDKTKLEMKSYFTLRLSSFFSALFLNTEGIYREIADILREGILEELHTKKLCNHIFRINERSDSIVIGDSEWTAFRNCSGDVFIYLSHYQLFSYLLDGLIHPKKKLTLSSGSKRCAALIGAVILSREDGSLAINCGATLNSLLEELVNLSSICVEILSMEYSGSLAIDKCAQIVAIMKMRPVFSIIVLRWLHYTVCDVNFISTSAYAALCPMFLQLVVTAIDFYPALRPDCFVIIWLMYNHKTKSEDTDTGRTVELISIRKDIVEVLIHLLGKGYVQNPLNFLVSEAQEVDAAVLRHIVQGFLQSFSAPYDVEYVDRVIDIIIIAGNRKALLSKFFLGSGNSLLLQFFFKSVSGMSGVDENKLSQLKEIVCVCLAGSSDQL